SSDRTACPIAVHRSRRSQPRVARAGAPAPTPLLRHASATWCATWHGRIRPSRRWEDPRGGGRRKAENLYDDWNQQRHSHWQKSPAIRDAFPGVEAVRINLTFDDPEKVGNPQPKQLKFGPEQRALFHIACPFRECVRGGFDLGPVV